jgi:hypothetical protein
MISAPSTMLSLMLGWVIGPPGLRRCSDRYWLTASPASSPEEDGHPAEVGDRAAVQLPRPVRLVDDPVVDRHQPHDRA